jgi:uncharacterized protein (DUF302 family)
VTSPTPGSERGVVSLPSAYSFDDTVQRLLSAFTSHGLKIFAKIDQMAEASAAGLVMPPATLLIFGNPKAGTPLMLAQPVSALDLPLKALVTESAPGHVLVSFNTATYILQRHSLPEELSSNLAPAERLIAAAIAGNGPVSSAPPPSSPDAS